MRLEEVKEYYDNGKICRHYFFDEQDNLHGKYVSYYENGIVWCECTYNNGKRHGKYVDYYRDGTICYLTCYWHGEEVTKAEFLRLKYDEVMKCN